MSSASELLEEAIITDRLRAMHFLLKKHCLQGNSVAVLTLITSRSLSSNSLFWDTCSYKPLIAQVVLEHCERNKIPLQPLEAYHLLHPLLMASFSSETKKNQNGPPGAVGLVEPTNTPSNGGVDRVLREILAKLLGIVDISRNGDDNDENAAGGVAASQLTQNNPATTLLSEGSSQMREDSQQNTYSGNGSSASTNNTPSVNLTELVAVLRAVNQGGGHGVEEERKVGTSATEAQSLAAECARITLPEAKIQDFLRNQASSKVMRTTASNRGGGDVVPTTVVQTSRTKRSREEEEEEEEEVNGDDGTQQQQGVEEGEAAEPVEVVQKTQEELAAAQKKDEEVYAILRGAGGSVGSAGAAATTRAGPVVGGTTALVGGGGAKQQQEFDDFDEIEGVTAPTAPKEPQRRNRFTAEEDKAILEGMTKFAGTYRFQNIFESYRHVWQPGRTYGQLVDHWRQHLRTRALAKGGQI